MGIDNTIGNIVGSVNRVADMIDRQTKAAIVIICVAFSVFFGVLYWRSIVDNNKEVQYWKDRWAASEQRGVDKDKKIYSSDSARQAMSDYWYNFVKDIAIKKGLLNDTTK